jgi:hypothetical protein
VRDGGNLQQAQKGDTALWLLSRVLPTFVKRWLGSKINEDKLSKVKLPLCGALGNCLGQTRSHYGGTIETAVINSANHFAQPGGHLHIIFPIIYIFLLSDVISK